MKKSVKTNVKFKDYSPGQTLLLPPSLEEMIDANHPVRIVNRVIDQVEMDPLIEKFKGVGTSSYHPRMLLKVIVFAYLSNTYSSRRMEAALAGAPDLCGKLSFLFAPDAAALRS